MHIEIGFKAYRKMMAAVASTPMEVSGFGTVSVWRAGDDGVREPFAIKRFKDLPPKKDYGIIFRVEDTWILDKGSSALTEITPRVAAKFLAERDADGTDLSTIKLWWHRHPLPKGWSQTDENGIALNPMSSTPESVGWMVSMVWCSHSGWNARFDQVAGKRFAIDIPITVEGFSQKIELEAQKTVHDLDRTPVRVASKASSPKPRTEEKQDLTRWINAPVTVNRAASLHQFRADLAEEMAMAFFDELCDQDLPLEDEDANTMVIEAYYNIEETINKYGNNGEELIYTLNEIARRWDIDSKILFDAAIAAWQPPQSPLPGFEELVQS